MIRKLHVILKNPFPLEHSSKSQEITLLLFISKLIYLLYLCVYVTLVYLSVIITLPCTYGTYPYIIFHYITENFKRYIILVYSTIISLALN